MPDRPPVSGQSTPVASPPRPWLTDQSSSRNRRARHWLFGLTSIRCIAVMMAGLLLGIILPAAVNNQSTVARIEHPWGVVDAIRQFATSANASESTRRGFLLNLLNEDVTYLKRYARAGDVEGVIASEPGDAGNRLTDAIRRPTGDMAAEEQGLARTGPAQQPLSQSTMTFILIGSGLFAVGCIVVSTVMIFRVMTANAIARRAMAAAAESQEMLDMINVAALMVLRDFDGTIHFWSEGCRRLYGWTAAQAVGRLSHELLQTVYPGSRGEVEAALRRHGTWQGELRQRTTDGAEVTVAACKNLQRLRRRNRHGDRNQRDRSDFAAQGRVRAAKQRGAIFLACGHGGRWLRHRQFRGSDPVGQPSRAPHVRLRAGRGAGRPQPRCPDARGRGDAAQPLHRSSPRWRRAPRDRRARPRIARSPARRCGVSDRSLGQLVQQQWLAPSNRHYPRRYRPKTGRNDAARK